MADIRYLNSFGMPGGFNITNGEPIDSRMYVADIAHIYDPKNWETVEPYNGLIVSDPNGNIRICVDAKNYQLEASWKVVNVGDIKIPEVAVKGVDSNDKILSLNGGYINSTLGVNVRKLTETEAGYDENNPNKEYIILTGKNNEIISKVDASRFVVDGMIESVVMGKDDVLTITWNTDAGSKQTTIDFGKYIDIHPGARRGVKKVTEDGKTYFEGVVDPDSEKYLTVGDNGFKIEGIDDINEQV
jgi:hypothetical protein